MPSGTPARLTLPDKQSIFVTLSDISKGGCCIVRSGNLALKPSEMVRIEIWHDDMQLKISFPASVRWSKNLSMSSKAGLRFIDTSTKNQRYIQQYLSRTLPI